MTQVIRPAITARPLDRGRVCDALRQACPWLGGDPSLAALVSLLAEPRRVKLVHLHHGYLVLRREAEELGCRRAGCERLAQHRGVSLDDVHGPGHHSWVKPFEQGRLDALTLDYGPCATLPGFFYNVQHGLVHRSSLLQQQFEQTGSRVTPDPGSAQMVHGLRVVPAYVVDVHDPLPPEPTG